MHELPFTKGIYRSVMKKAESVNAKDINRVVLEIGVLHDFIPEFVQKYWDFISKGSIAEGSKIEIRWKNAQVQCGSCMTIYEVGKEEMNDPKCPSCQYEFGTMLSGNELRIVGIEIVKNKPTESPQGE